MSAGVVVEVSSALCNGAEDAGVTLQMYSYHTLYI